MKSPSLATPSQRLAADLLRRAVAAFTAIPAAERLPLLPGIDRFLAQPGPATYLAAARTLAAAQRRRSIQAARTARAEQAVASGLALVGSELGPATAATLAAAPIDARAGQRLRALALLCAAQRELAERVAGSSSLLMQQLALGQKRAAAKPVARPKPPAPRRARLPSAAAGPKPGLQPGRQRGGAGGGD
jgi:hypothetical protein